MRKDIYVGRNWGILAEKMQDNGKVRECLVCE